MFQRRLKQIQRNLNKVRRMAEIGLDNIDVNKACAYTIEISKN